MDDATRKMIARFTMGIIPVLVSSDDKAALAPLNAVVTLKSDSHLRTRLPLQRGSLCRA